MDKTYMDKLMEYKKFRKRFDKEYQGLCKKELNPIESEHLFAEFLSALVDEVVNHPEKLHTAKQVWDKEWDKLLKEVTPKKVNMTKKYKQISARGRPTIISAGIEGERLTEKMQEQRRIKAWKQYEKDIKIADKNHSKECSEAMKKYERTK